MTKDEIIIGDRVLVQSGHELREHAQIKGILDNGHILVRLSDNRIVDLAPAYILKSFGQP